ncbi:MAG TPA: hypothetical protein DCE41_28015 [Cytophagales bacterium]|nr:hypothetical protein [Cytophagales bacterium]HAA18295.1 hypothetical protein [Cytophagales bacterium]HAP63884.1 hypothetical protein [Cytophagales bacterium]
MSEVQKEINSRILEFIEFKGLSLHRFGEMASFASGGLSRAIKENRTFSVDKLMKIYEAFPELNPTWLLFGKGRMIADGFELVEAPGKVKTYVFKANEAKEDLKDYSVAEDRIKELEKEVVVLEAKNEALMEVLREMGYMGTRPKDDKKK